jgi:hypothetical protein
MPPSLINDERPWLVSRAECGRTTPFSRVQHIWFNLNQAAYEESGSMEFNSLGTGYTWKFGRRGLLDKTLDMRAWSAACATAIISFQEAVISLTSNNCHLMDAFNAHKIDDSKTRPAPHRQPKNKAWMDPIRKDLFKKIWGTVQDIDKQIICSKAESWLRNEQRALEALAFVFWLACGVSFRGWQINSIFFDCSKSQNRNVWVLSDGTFIISHPRAKQYKGQKIGLAPTLLAFPRKLSPYLGFYLFIIRPIACNLLEVLDCDISLHSTVLWVSSTPKGRKNQSAFPWNGRHLSQILQRFTAKEMGLALVPMLVRQASQAVFRDTFPQLFLNIVKNSAAFTELDQYGQRSNFPPDWKDISPERSARLVAVSQIWQALLEIEPVNQVWLPLLQGSRIFLSQNKEYFESTFYTAYRYTRCLPEAAAILHNVSRRIMHYFVSCDNTECLATRRGLV